MGRSTTRVLDTAAGRSVALTKISLNRANEDLTQLKWAFPFYSPALTTQARSSHSSMISLEIKLFRLEHDMPALGIQSHWLWEGY